MSKNSKIILLGGNGYIGSYIRSELDRRGITYTNYTRDYTIDKTGKPKIYDIIKHSPKRSILINAAGYTGKPNVDACENNKDECFYNNVSLPTELANVCNDNGIIYGHLSSGCIYTGDNGGEGFTEEDKPNFSWEFDNCSYYSGTKAKCEQMLKPFRLKYIWRIRIPFNGVWNKRNYICKLLNYDRLINEANSLSYIEQAVDAIIDTYFKDLDFGTYNITNSGEVYAKDVVELCRKHKILKHEPEYITNDKLTSMVTAPRSNCILNNKKALNAGLKLDDCISLVEASIKKLTIDSQGAF